VVVAEFQLPIVIAWLALLQYRVLQTASLVAVTLFAHRVGADIILAVEVVFHVPEVVPRAQVQARAHLVLVAITLPVVIVFWIAILRAILSTIAFKANVLVPDFCTSPLRGNLVAMVIYMSPIH